MNGYTHLVVNWRWLSRPRLLVADAFRTTPDALASHVASARARLERGNTVGWEVSDLRTLEVVASEGAQR